MKEVVELNFSHRFPGIVWNTLVVPQTHLLWVEVRNHERKEVSFSVLNYHTAEFCWKDIALEERWWITLSSATKDIALFTIYLETDNPDRKGVLAYDTHTMKLLWWNNDFSITSTANDHVAGFSSRQRGKTFRLEITTGVEIDAIESRSLSASSAILKPTQYTDGMDYFETVKQYLHTVLNLTPVVSLEYLEVERRIIISYYEQENDLANYLLIISDQGELLLKEKIDEQLKGIGLDTFFVLAGSVFFVKNKVELVSYSLYDK